MKLNNTTYKSLVLLGFFAGFFFAWPGNIKASHESITLNVPVGACLTSGGVSGPQISLAWSDTFHGGNPTFQIFRMIPGETLYALIGATNSNTFVDTVVNGLASDKSYRYEVHGEKGSSGLKISNEQNVSALYCEPVILSASPSCSEDGPHIGLNWSSITGSLNKYEIYRDNVKIGETAGVIFSDGPNIEGGAAYNYKIRAIWQNLTSKDSSAAQATASFCAPILTVSASCENSGLPGGPRADLSWNGLLGVESYQIYRKAQSESSFSLLGTVSGSTTSYVDFLVNSLNSTYQNGGNSLYYVKALWNLGEKDSASETIAIPRCAPFLAVDTNCQDFSFDLSWSKTKDATFYNIYRSGSFLSQVSSIENSYKDFMDLTSCAGEVCTHTYRVEAAVSGNPNMSSNNIEKSIDCATLVAPSPAPHMEEPIAYCESGDSRISLGTSVSDPGWSSSNNASNYSIFRNSVEEAIRTVRWYVDSNIQSGIDYVYYIVANGGGGTSTVSDNAYTVTSVSCAAPTTPSITSLIAGCSSGNPNVNISWSSTINTEAYEIHRGTTPGGLSLLIEFDKDTPEYTSRSWQDNGVSASTLYYYKVVAIGPPGVLSSSSVESSVTTTSCAPTIPVLSLSTSCVSGSARVSLSWSTNHANTSNYIIERRDAGGGNLTSFPLQFPPTTSLTDETVENSKAYEYRVTAVGPVGNSTEGFKPITSDSCMPTVPALSLTPQCIGSSSTINLTWSTDEKNTLSYEIFRKDYSEVIPIATILNPATKLWTDDGSIAAIANSTAYEYKVEAVGTFSSLRSTEGYKIVISLNCSPPGPFALSVVNPPMCVGSYLRANLSWTASSNATSYNLYRNQSSPLETASFLNVTPFSFTDIGLGRTLNFSGSTSNYVIANSFSGFPTTEITFAFWMRSSDTAKNGTPLSYASGNSGNQDNEFIVSNYNNFAIHRRGSSTGPTGVSANDGKWHHIGVTWKSGGGGVVKIYKDGAEAYSGNLAGGTSMAGGGALVLGQEQDSVGGGFDSSVGFVGNIDEVYAYNRVLTSGEVSQLYNGTYSSRNGLVGLWHFDEGGGSTLSDSSNRGNNGTIFGASWMEGGMFYERNYNWQAEASNIGGTTFATPNPTSNHLSPMCVPTHPGVTAVSYCDSGLNIPVIDISWSYSINTSNYEVYREQGASDALIGTVGQTSNEALRNIIDNNFGIGLLPNTSYSYYVVVNSVAALPDTISDTVSAETPNCTLPTKPVITSLEFQCSGSFPQARIRWSDSNFTDYYTIYRDGAPLSPNITDTNSGTYTLIDTGISSGTAYTYTVRAFGPGGSMESDPAFLPSGNFCDPSTPSIISVISSCQNGSRINTVSWSDAAPSNTTSYKIFRDGSVVKIIASSDPEFSTRIWDNDLGSGSGESFSYKVQALGPKGSSPLSSAKSVTTFTCGVTPTAPSSLSVSISCVAGIPQSELSWNASQNAYSYRIYRGQGLSTPVLTYNTRISPEKDKGSYALNFGGADNTTTADNYTVRIPNSNALDIKGDLTIALWVNTNTNTVGSEDTLVSNRRNGSGNGTAYEFRVGPGRNLAFNQDCGRISGPTSPACTVSGSTGSGSTVNSSQTISMNTWHHIVVRRMGAKTIAFFIDGAKDPIGDQNLSDNAGDENQPVLMGDNSSGIRDFGGLMDDIRVYNRALSDIEIQGIASGVYENEEGLVGVWHMDEGSGTTVKDSSGLGNNGVLDIGPPIWVTLSSADSSFDSGPLVSGESYTYYVTGFSNDNESNPSNTISIIANCNPTAPVLTTTTQCVSGDSGFLLEWGADPNTDYWDIFKRRDEDPFTFLVRVFPPALSYSDSDVENAVDYDYFITAVGFSGSTVSNSDGGTSLMCLNPPLKPAFINSTPDPVCFGTSSRVKLEWSSDITGNTIFFNVRRNNVTAGETGFAIRNPGLAGDDTDDYDLVSPDNDYEYKIEAVGSGTNNISLSDVSPIVTGLDCVNLPPSPANLSLNTIISTAAQVSVSISWSDSGPEQDYRVFRSINGGATFSEIAHLVAGSEYFDSDSTIFYVDNTITDGVSYVYRIYAYNNSASFDSSNPLKSFNSTSEPEGGIASNDLNTAIPIAIPGPFTAEGQWINLQTGPFRVTWEESDTTANGECIIYNVLKDDNVNFSSPQVVCSDITEESPDCRGVPGPEDLECDDVAPTLFERFYKVTATNVAGSTDSSIVELTPPLPKYKEITP
ncbi:MAG: hypothetical protein A2827_03025 [Candidatus Spechtbacteria bacterium RIFCSPHIGHO2_01_FULL_43_30]|uniref:Staphylococcus aureus surface protein A n=1 Tax=Candidatus Spechtbacteria bacterium RIFCSPHIGHO2_01_FULL_43_30 TaxID=1802158 RepID=A0A1G2H503_9BACT|nr:MAG: hypothetical protein A2827_03025 [Candidatus Spechtbacteria bacterium RIFCSPHIGHO2_01_FULL_43_30]